VPNGEEEVVKRVGDKKRNKILGEVK